jgi:hypothetical protein
MELFAQEKKTVKLNVRELQNKIRSKSDLYILLHEHCKNLLSKI